MPWNEDTEEGESQAERVTTAFTVIRDVPSRPTARVQKVSANAGKSTATSANQALENSGILLQA